MDIFSYVVARDFGFAPNPFYQVCTLATCKPKIREAAQIGDLVVGSRASPHVHQLVYFMYVDDVLTYDQYWTDPRFQSKKPNLHGSIKVAFGDNIYHRDTTGTWLQLDSHHTNEDGSPCEDNLRTDTSSEKVLISRNFAYWGGNGPELPGHLHFLVKKGPGYKREFTDEFKRELLDWLEPLDRGFLGAPTEWDHN